MNAHETILQPVLEGTKQYVIHYFKGLIVGKPMIEDSFGRFIVIYRRKFKKHFCVHSLNAVEIPRKQVFVN